MRAVASLAARRGSPQRPPDRPTAGEDVFAVAHRAALAHLEALGALALLDPEEVDWAAHGAAAPFDGCPDCVVREVMHVTVPILLEEISRE